MNWLNKLLSNRQTLEQTSEWAKQEQQKANEQYNQELTQLNNKLLSLREKGLTILIAFANTNQEHPELYRILREFFDKLGMPAHERDFTTLHAQFKQLAEQTLPTLKEIKTQEVQAIKEHLNEVEQNFIKPYTHLKQRDEIITIQNLITQLETIKKEKETVEQHKLSLIDKKEKLELEQQEAQQEKERLSNTEEFKEIKKQLLEKATERKQAEKEINDLFTTIKPVLNSYSQKTGSAICKSYLENPVEAIMKDYSLNISKQYAELYKETISEEIHKALSKLNKKDLGKLLHAYATAKKKEADLHNALASRNVMKKYDDLLVSFKKFADEIKDLEEEISLLNYPNDKEIKQQLQEKLNKHKIILI